MNSNSDKPTMKDATPEQRAIMISCFREMDAEGLIVRVPGTGEDPLTCTWKITGLMQPAESASRKAGSCRFRPWRRRQDAGRTG
jgi:hypothetical protein